MRIELSKSQIAARPKSPPLAHQKIAFPGSTLIYLGIGKEHLFQFFKFEAIPIQIRRRNISQKLSASIRCIQSFTRVMLKYFSAPYPLPRIWYFEGNFIGDTTGFFADFLIRQIIGTFRWDTDENEM